jgi:periplasmic protein TonB
LSRVFDARKQAEKSKSARETKAETLQLPEVETPDASITKGAVAQQAPIVRSLLRVPRSASLFTAPRASNVVQHGGQSEPATLISAQNPIYPAIAKQHLISGSVEVHFRISREGKVYNVKSAHGSPVLAKAAIEVVETWRYEPARLNGEPIDSQASTNFDFKLS